MYKSGLHSIVHITAPEINLAKTIARDIVKHDLAACVNLIPSITSVYKWEDEVMEDSETLMIIKTRTSRVEDLTKYVTTNYPYNEVCEVISTKIDNGNISYLNWISESVPEDKLQGSNIDKDAIPKIKEENNK